LGVFEAIGSDTHEEVLFGNDPVSGLRTIIAIHSSVLGPALGGTRFYAYASEQDALVDALRLSKGMTYKSAAAGLDLGGGKAVIIGDPGIMKTERLLRAYGKIIDSLCGRYVTAEDVGTTPADMAIVSRETSWVAGLPSELGGSGDPSPATARGVMNGMRAVAERLWDSEDLSGRTVAVQGVGKVGGSLVARLTKAGAATVVTDVDRTATERMASEHGSSVVGLEEIYDVECDIFAPCALGSSLSARTIPRLRCAAVVGSANNQLADEEADSERLASRGIVYAPDFVVNAGGIINIAIGINGYQEQRAATAIDDIQGAVTRVLELSAGRGIHPHQAAVMIAEERIAQIGSLPRRRGLHRSP
jgi:leucine dehydrogenase